MKKLLVVLPILTVCVWPAAAQSDDAAEIGMLRAQNRLLKAENTLLKSQIKTLKSKLSAGATTRPTNTFSIQEEDPEWWRDPDALIFQVRLREILADRMPHEAPRAWITRNNHHAGKDVSWTIKILSVTSVREADAGQQMWSLRRSIDSQKKQIESMKKQADSATSAEGKASVLKTLSDAMLRLAKDEADSRLWRRLVDLKGGTVLQAGIRKRIGARPVDVLSVRLALRAEEAEKLKKYQEAKRVKYAKSSGSSSRYRRRDEAWPVRVAGKVDSVLYDGTTIHVFIDGKWFTAPGDGRTKTTAPPTRKTVLKRYPVVPAGRPGYVNLRY